MLVNTGCEDASNKVSEIHLQHCGQPIEPMHYMCNTEIHKVCGKWQRVLLGKNDLFIQQIQCIRLASDMNKNIAT